MKFTRETKGVDGAEEAICYLGLIEGTY